MGILNWLCTKSTRNMLVKIVHPGGHAELHDRPVLAAEIMLRNPRCLVAYPRVFQHPWAIVAPDTMLILGQKFYLVPISTIRKLQRNSFKSPLQKTRSSKSGEGKEEESHEFSATCWFHMHNNVIQSPYVCSQHSKNTCKRSDSNTDNKCFVCLLSGVESHGGRDNRSEVTSSLSSFESPENIETIAETRKKNSTRGNPNKLSSIEYYWQTSLESVVEE